jgi:hypothetical protein
MILLSDRVLQLEGCVGELKPNWLAVELDSIKDEINRNWSDGLKQSFKSLSNGKEKQETEKPKEPKRQAPVRAE